LRGNYWLRFRACGLGRWFIAPIRRLRARMGAQSAFVAQRNNVVFKVAIAPS
jgi:hypothetical protein